jgi:TRAP-type mannitol/chloroaromatic compound transport system substrate-binding protein
MLTLGIASNSFSQEPVVQQTVEDLLESVGENMSENTNFQEILDDLESFRQHPLQINMATNEELNQ